MDPSNSFAYASGLTPRAAIPDSYIKHGLCRYNYPPDALPPLGIGKKTIDQAIINLGVQRISSGPKGGVRWHLPEVQDTHPDPESPTPTGNEATEEPYPKNAEKSALCSKLVYEAIPGGPKVLEVAIPGQFSSDPPKLKYYVCVGEQKYPHSTPDAAKAACDKFAEPQQPKEEEICG